MASSYSYLHLAFCTTSRMPSPGTLPKLKDHKLGGDSLHTGCSPDLSFLCMVLEDISLPQDLSARFCSLLWTPVTIALVADSPFPSMSPSGLL